MHVYYDPNTEVAEIYDSQGLVASLKHFSGMMFVFECESRYGARMVRAAPLAPRLKGIWPADDYEGFYAEYYYRRFHQAADAAKADERQAAAELLKEIGL